MIQVYDGSGERWRRRKPARQRKQAFTYRFGYMGELLPWYEPDVHHFHATLVPELRRRLREVHPRGPVARMAGQLMLSVRVAEEQAVACNADICLHLSDGIIVEVNRQP